MDTPTMVATVQVYIGHRTGKQVDINMSQFNDPMNILLLQSAYSVAIRWLQENNVKTTSV